MKQNIKKNHDVSSLGDRVFHPKWNYQDLAQYLGVSVQKLRQDVMKKRIPYTKLGRSVRFDPLVIQKWFEENTFDPEA